MNARLEGLAGLIEGASSMPNIAPCTALKTMIKARSGQFWLSFRVGKVTNRIANSQPSRGLRLLRQS
ncbi:hypothetical protein VJJ19_07790, partial [Parvimonas sp. D4]|uniref:hypothetical protein n=1 Tax=Parvimonas sp. D4 TaxID=3110690 RepID=UPI002B486F66